MEYNFPSVDGIQKFEVLDETAYIKGSICVHARIVANDRTLNLFKQTIHRIEGFEGTFIRWFENGTFVFYIDCFGLEGERDDAFVHGRVESFFTTLFEAMNTELETRATNRIEKRQQVTNNGADTPRPSSSRDQSPQTIRRGHHSMRRR